MSKKISRITATISILWLASVAGPATADPGLDVSHFPPWQNGGNNPSNDKGLEFTVREADNLADFHGDLANARLVLYVGGNYFFAMAPLVAAFEQDHPDLKGHIYYETIPHGLLVRQMHAGGRITVGNMTWTAKPDAYFGGLMAVKKLIDAGDLIGPPTVYATNQLAMMVLKGNPAGIRNLTDLGRPDIKLAMPNPEFEGVSRQVKAALAKAGGDALVTAVYDILECGRRGAPLGERPNKTCRRSHHPRR